MILMSLIWLPHISESPRWLLTKCRYRKARKILKVACKRNGKMEDFEKRFTQLKHHFNVDKSGNNGEQQKEPLHKSIFALFRNKKFCITTLILWTTFYVNGFIYHGFSLNIDIIGGNVFINFALAGLIEVPSTAINIIGMKYFGRRIFTMSAILAAATCYITIAILRWLTDIPTDHMMVIGLSLIAKMFIFCTYNAIYIHAGEIFPTQLRHMGVSSCSIASRFGSTVAPFVKEIVSCKYSNQTD